MELNYTIIGKQIKHIRKRKRITQEHLAEIIDISTSYISYIENAKKHPGLETLIGIANALCVSVDRLLDSNLLYRHEYKDEFSEILEDCSEYERRIIIEMARSLKQALRDDRR